MDRLIYQNTPTVTFATNTFINVPIIFQFEKTPLISIIKSAKLGFTTEIPIYNNDGVYIAKVRGTRVYPTNEGKKVGIIMRQLPSTTVCEMNNKPLFEIYHKKGEQFRIDAELYTPTGTFIKSSDSPLIKAIDKNGEALQIGGVTMSNCTFNNLKIGFLLNADGSVAVGCS